jgi:MoaA/NifB/PqqE/SkfB family radical SAM enzyme
MHEIPHGEEFYFQWHLTERCNRACKHCYQNGISPELPLSTLLEVLDKIEELSSKS